MFATILEIKSGLRISTTITGFLAFLSIAAIVFLYLALCDIAKNEQDLTLEWYLAGICMIVIGAFILSTLVTIGFLFYGKEKSKVNQVSEFFQE